MDQQLNELQLQSRCFLWSWNTFPQTRGHLWHVTNEVKKMRLQLPNDEWIEETDQQLRTRIAKLKAAGLVPGVYDLHFFWNGRLHVFELKVGYNKLSGAQIEWGNKMQGHGAVLYEVRDEQLFRQLFINIITTK